MNQINRLFSAKVLQYQNLLAEKKAAAGLGPTGFSRLMSQQLAQDIAITNPITVNDSPPPLKPEPIFSAQIKPATVPENDDYTSLIKQTGATFNLDPALIRAVIQVESRFQPEAVSRAGAMGLMQLMPATAASFAVRDPFDPGQNITAGAHVLRQHLDSFSDLRLALAAYNAGPGRINSLAIQDPDDPAQYEKISPAVRNYVTKVLAYYDQYSQDRAEE